jgi:MoaA/NifB/PqqE/SkfB family radical SAM enzyme
MSVRECVFPWNWAVITNQGEVLPCSHGAGAVGHLRDSSLDEIWNGPAIQDLRAALLRGEVPALCAGSGCPYQQDDPSFPKLPEPLHVDEDFARAFDHEWYLTAYPDAAQAVRLRHFTSGLEHYIRHGRAEGRAYQLKQFESPLDNAALGFVEYSQGATRLRARPVTLVLAVSTICNLRCVMCPHGMNLVDQPQHMALALVEQVGDYLRTASRLLVSGLGEPMGSPAFWDILERAGHRDDLWIHANSNGHMMTASRAEKLVDSGLSEISFSLDAATAGTYAKIRGGDFYRALHGISLLVQARRERASRTPDICINMTLMRENLPEIAAFVRLAKELGVDGVILTQLFVFGDRPDWKVERPGGWTFVYSEQMPTRHSEETGRQLQLADACSREIGMPIRYQCNVTSYLTAIAEPALR